MYYKHRFGVTLREVAESRVNALVHAEGANDDAARDRLVHELQVHKVELELQNEELANAYGELALVRDKYVDLYDFAPVAYFTVTPVGEIVELNVSAAALLGEPRESLVGRRLNDYMKSDSMLAFADLLSAACEGTGEVVGALEMQRTQEKSLSSRRRRSGFVRHRSVRRACASSS